MSLSAKEAILSELAKASPLGCEEVSERLPGFSVAEVNNATDSLIADGLVIPGYETDGRVDYTFSWLQKP